MKNLYLGMFYSYLQKTVCKTHAFFIVNNKIVLIIIFCIVRFLRLNYFNV